MESEPGMSDRAERVELAGPPPSAGLPPGVWVDRYFRWRLDSVSAYASPGADAPACEPAALPALTDAALDTVDVGAYIERMRADSAARGIPAGLLLAERRPSVLRPSPAAVPAEPEPLSESPDLRELLRHDGVEFLRHAYLALLDREPDWGGLTSYLAQLHGAKSDKIAVLYDLRHSPEGRARRRPVRGLALHMMYHRLRASAPARFLRAALRRLQLAARRGPSAAGSRFARPSTAPVE
jgi:hypothetical protein